MCMSCGENTNKAPPPSSKSIAGHFSRLNCKIGWRNRWCCGKPGKNLGHHLGKDQDIKQAGPHDKPLDKKHKYRKKHQVNKLQSIQAFSGLWQKGQKQNKQPDKKVIRHPVKIRGL